MALRIATMPVIIVAAIIGAELGAQEIPAPPEFASSRGYVQRLVDSGATPGASIAVIRNKKLVWAEGFGFADVAKQKPATSNSIYRLASISKPITATGMMMLVDKGELDLDAPANDYLRGAKLRAPVNNNPEAMTLRRLANHSSGMPIHYNFYYNGVEPLSMDEVIRRHGFAAAEPGQTWEYCNLAYGILNHLTELAAGQPWGDYMEQRLYDPLNMNRTSHRIRPAHLEDAVVQYRLDTAGRYLPVEHYEFDHPGGSVVCSTVRDLSRFALFHLNEGELDEVRLLDRDTVRQMQVPTSPAGAARRVGIAWFISTDRGRRVISHSGGMPGVTTMLRIYPADGAAIVMLTNRSGLGLNESLNRLARDLFPEPGPAESDAASQAEERPEPPERPEPGGSWSGLWKGTLEHHDGPITMELEIEQDKSWVRLGTGPRQELVNASRGGISLRGQIDAQLRLQAGFHGSCELRFDLTRRDDRLTGKAVAMANGYFALSHWVDLTKAP